MRTAFLPVPGAAGWFSVFCWLLSVDSALDVGVALRLPELTCDAAGG